MEVQNKYNNGKIYKLIDKSNDNKVIYIGSTTQKLNERFRKHKSLSKFKPHIKVYNYISNIGWNNVDIELIENFNCNNKKELETRERYYIDEFETSLNIVKPGRTKQEYINDNKNKISEYHKNYKEQNEDQLKEYYKSRYLSKHDDIIKRTKNYYEKNKILISEKRKEIYVCECGSESTQCHKARHEKTKKHLNFINNMNNN